MLLPLGIVCIPGLNQGHVHSQIVNMPMPSFVASLMAHYSSSHTTWTERAADIYVVTLPQQNLSQSSNYYFDVERTPKNECIGTGLGLQEVVYLCNLTPKTAAVCCPVLVLVRCAMPKFLTIFVRT
jgi:hypothetical protein